MNISKLTLKTLFVSAVLTLCACASVGDGTVAEKRQAILDMQANALARLYKEKPDTRSQIRDAAGYAVFTNANINVIFLAAGTGYGVVNNNVTGVNNHESRHGGPGHRDGQQTEETHQSGEERVIGDMRIISR